jgi:hypothetical protein
MQVSFLLDENIAAPLAAKLVDILLRVNAEESRAVGVSGLTVHRAYVRENRRYAHSV